MVICITGASSGIGFSLANYLGKKGYKVYGVSRRKIESPLFYSISADITDHNQVSSAVAEIKGHEDRIDVLINNAGMGMVGTVEGANKEEIIRLFELNVIGATQLMSAVLPIMKAQKKGKIINISSIGSEMGLPFRGFYSASKAALDKLTEALRYEVYSWGVEACILHLGDVKTGIAEKRIQSGVSEDYQETYRKIYEQINAHVDSGISPERVAVYIEKLLGKRKFKAHYYCGKWGQRAAVTLKRLLPQTLFEKLMKKYNQLP
ncbi:MAG: SDR family oxidoreductase [Bergeyella sp.]|nr:SDR family oxidoreductase [Bergeyella sp.]